MRTQATIRAISAICSSGVLFRLARLCPIVTETGTEMRIAPASIAACTPRRLGANPTTTTFGNSTARRTISGVSAICRISFGETKLPTSICGNPAAAIAAIQRVLTAVGIRPLAIWSPSRGPTSQIVTVSTMAQPS